MDETDPRSARLFRQIERKLNRQFPELRKHLEIAPPAVVRDVQQLILHLEQGLQAARRRGQRDAMTGRAR